MRKIAKELDSDTLLEEYSNIVIQLNLSAGEAMEKYNLSRDEVCDKIDLLTKDRFSGLYAEVMHRFGYREEQIAEMLKSNPLLGYENGQELQYVNIPK